MRRLVLIALCAASLLSCAPPYNATLASSILTLQKLTHESTIGPLNLTDVDPLDDYCTFRPEKTDPAVTGTSGVDTSRGFVTYSVSSSPGQYGGRTVHLGYCEPDPNNPGSYSFFEGTPLTASWSSSAPPVMFQALKYGALISVTIFNENDPSQNTQAVYQADTPTRTFLARLGPLNMGSSFQAFTLVPGKAVGYSPGVPSELPADDQSCWLFIDQAGTGYQIAFNTSSQSFSPYSPAAGFVSPFFASWLNRCLYFYNPGAGRGYALSWDGRAWQGLWWSATASAQLPPAAHRPDVILSTGEFLSADGQVAYVYDQDMKLLGSFPLGTLKFALEAYAGGTPTVFFSSADATAGGLYFDLYSIPTASLKTLAQ